MIINCAKRNEYKFKNIILRVLTEFLLFLIVKNPPATVPQALNKTATVKCAPFYDCF